MKKATVKWKIGFLRLENGKCLFLRPENENSTPSCPPSVIPVHGPVVSLPVIVYQGNHHHIF